MVNDLGLPDACHKYPNYRYFTGEVHGQGEEFEHRGYLGLCFSSECTTNDMNEHAGNNVGMSDIIVNSLLNISIVSNTTKMNFFEPVFHTESTAGEIVCLILFLLLFVVSMKEVVFNFFKSCKKEALKED